MYILVKDNVIVAEETTISKLLINHFKIHTEKDTNKIIAYVDTKQVATYKTMACDEVEVINELVIHIWKKQLKGWGYKIYKEV